MFMLRKTAIAGLTALALSVLSTAPFAQSFTNGSVATFATQAVTAASGALTIPAGLIHTSPTTALPSTGGSFLITFTLPSGVTFSVAPTAVVSATGGLCTTGTINPTNSAAGANSATFSVTVNAAAAAGSTCSVALNGFTVAGATALGTTTPANSYNMSEQVSASTGTAPTFNQNPAVKATLATSASQLTYFTLPGASGGNGNQVIDISGSILGKQFKTVLGTGTCGNATGTDNLCADLGTLVLVANANSNSTATGPFKFTATAANVTLTGNWSGIGSAVLSAPSAGACKGTASAQTAVTGAVSGTISGSTITFAGLNGGSVVTNPFGATGYGPTTVTYEVCLYAGGTALIGSNPVTLANSASIDTTNQADTSAPGTGIALYNYNGVVQQLLYATAGTSHPGYVRIINNTASPIQVFASVQPDGGTTGTAQVETALAGFANDLVPVSTIATNAGVTLGANGRTAMTLFAPGPVATPGTGAAVVGISLLEVNPSGDVVEMGSGTAP
jgi:hypothetical protein